MSFEQLLSQAKDHYHAVSKRIAELGDRATPEQLAEVDAAETDLLELLQQKREGTQDVSDDLKSKFAERTKQDQTRKFHDNVQAEMRRALDQLHAVEDAAAYFGADRFVADPSDPTRPLFRTVDGSYVPIREGVEQELPPSLRRHARGSKLDQLKAQLDEQQRVVDHAQQEALNSRASGGWMVRFAQERRKLEAIKRKIRQIEKANTPPKPARAIPASLQARLDAATRKADKLNGNAMATGAHNDQIIASQANRELRQIEREVQKATA